MNIQKLLQENSEKYAQKPALIFQDQVVTFSALYENVLKLTGLLYSRDIGKSDKVAIYLPNCLEYVYSYLACFCLGAVVVPLDYMLKSDELVSCLGHSETKLLIAKAKKDLSLEDIKKQVPSLQEILLTPIEYNETYSQIPEASISPKDPALIMYTSGTTGKPKGILLNYRHLEGSPRAMEYFVDLSDKDIKLVAIPFSHIGGFIYIQNCVIFGITLVIMERFQPYEFLKDVQKYQVTCFHIVPPMYNALLSLKQLEEFDLSSLRWVVVFGAPSSPEILERFHKYCPNARLLNGWGMTETCPPNTVTPLDSDNVASVGKPAPHCRIKIVDEDGRELAVNEVGEVVISGWIVMDGYYKDEETTNAMLRNGWLHTGDLGRFDSEGFLYIVGRKKEMIKVAGQIVYAPEVEASFYKHPAVQEVAVIGIPDALKGEAVKAFVVLKPASPAGGPGEAVTVEDLRYFARQHLANFKVPQSIDICEVLPKNRTGKIDKEALKRDFETKVV
ncbi:MAG: AMP-binding protein [Candidatus Omnitrophica bacterium]|nr:AMP-binding protein [Candidatus Omnitrophota bacterium]